MLAYNAPHSPWLLDTSHFGSRKGDKLLKKYRDKAWKCGGSDLRIVDRVDQNLGRLFAFLKESGGGEYVVLFMSDNGGVSKHSSGIEGQQGEFL